MKQTINPTINNQQQYDVNLANEETPEVSIFETPTGEYVLYINVDGVNLLRLYSKQPIAIDCISDATGSPLGRTFPTKRYNK